MSSIVARVEGRSSRCGLIGRVYRVNRFGRARCPSGQAGRRGPSRSPAAPREEDSSATDNDHDQDSKADERRSIARVGGGSDGLRACLDAALGDARWGGRGCRWNRRGRLRCRRQGGGRRTGAGGRAGLRRVLRRGLPLRPRLLTAQRSGRSSVPPSGTAMFSAQQRSRKVGASRYLSGLEPPLASLAKTSVAVSASGSVAARSSESASGSQSVSGSQSGVGFGVGRGVGFGVGRGVGLGVGRGWVRRRPGRRIRTDDRDHARHRRVDLAVVREPSRPAEGGRVRVADLEDRAAANPPLSGVTVCGSDPASLRLVQVTLSPTWIVALRG